MTLDDIDERIIALRRAVPLSRDAIAARLGMARSTVRHRVTRMTKGGIELYPPRGEDKWTPERLARLTELWEAGLLTAEQISDEIGVTKGAVIGKVHRLGLSARRKHVIRPPKPRAPRKPRPSRAKPKTVSKTEAAMVPAPVPETAVSFMDLTKHTCRWPIGDPHDPDFCFCGAHASEEAPYCVYHQRLSRTAYVHHGDVRPFPRERAA